MKEILDIIAAYTIASNEGKRMALATVVHVEGSSYRRPGARMLVTDDGMLTGAISGGCLEGDALRKALLAINQQQNKLVTYDTSDEDDAKFGVQLGCNGIVHILFEPIDPSLDVHPLHLLQELSAKRQEGVLVTLFSLSHPQLAVPGTCLLVLPDTAVSEQLYKEQYGAGLLEDANHALLTRKSFIGEYLFGEHLLTAFVEFLRPPVALVIAGAGNDAFPLAAIAGILGWQTTIIDGRATHANRQRFPKADKVIVAKPDQVLSQVEVDDQTVFVLMTHNYNYDLALLKNLLEQEKAVYIGSLGPKKKLDRMIGEMEDEGIKIKASQLQRIFGPVGLDLGAETAEEIALSVASEIKKVLSEASGLSLRDKREPIHQHQSDKNSVDL
ncbi:Xanthine and CO dehydrogenase maturation factor, XdhC/CoxF family [Pedobacter westerhofensis]|uniref:Xanthine and CO dehydrogenase maturation factor, XdhC/CoxF family n=1 Tax=Pedobacter westerhofensis TaxID=425512 RepID=A0A521CAW4_9SPHI|nr:XdhC/CoxI family protein [Pedobacter westerhofensis]SMO56505.1 Xanthine and CO dehydrogenase maturation factor, XdhC/CoxF family [Pedobacter westerhofensis]